MANINAQTLREILKGDTVFSEGENKVYQWVPSLSDWQLGVTALNEGTVTETTESFKATSPDGTKTEVVALSQATSGSIFSSDPSQIATSNNTLKAKLAQLDESVSNSGVLVFGGDVWERDWAGAINGVEYEHSNPSKYVLDSDDPSVGGIQIPATRQATPNEFTILKTSHTVTIERYYGNAGNSGPNVPANTIFRLDTASAANFTPYEGNDPNVSGVKAGFYKTVNAVDLSNADAFKNTLGTEILVVAEADADYSTAAAKASKTPQTNSENCGSDPLIDVANGVSDELAAPSRDDAGAFPAGTFWKGTTLGTPVSDAGTVANGFSNKNAKTLAAGDNWNIISSGLAQDIADGNTLMWAETPVLESTEALKYRE